MPKREDPWRQAALGFELRAMRVEYVIRLLVTAGHVAQEKVDEAFATARDFSVRSSPADGGAKDPQRVTAEEMEEAGRKMAAIRVDADGAPTAGLRKLTDEEIRQLDDETRLDESLDWPLRFARKLLAAAGYVPRETQ